ncbi:NAD(P)H-binding protein [Actinoplanes sp. TBRC 11911]|uniref:NAD(P)-dependent oxidoreductase n=1 Tax=Actinoplanes sp. TBRC 11911 TaxID=2729386 RepID=UPI00145F5E81|nr:NAD(P)H-binding protein [Actinoplanes sp. TBRC 11911]NMO53757.1 NAD(P)H-binding protein [Actinoplanes sp. TBRC 11911]
MDIVVFGAGGRAGRQAVAEASRRGHRVTAVVRRGHHDQAGVRVVTGDVTDAASIAAAAAGHDAAISAAVDVTAPPNEFFTASARALDAGLTKAGVRRLVVVGISSILPGASGAPLMEQPGFPTEYQVFALGHLAGLDELRKSELDWAYVAPAGNFDHDGTPSGRYRFADHGDMSSLITYADFAVALLDEIEAPRHHRATASVRS